MNTKLIAGVVIIIALVAFLWKGLVLVHKENDPATTVTLLQNLELDLKVKAPVQDYNYIDWVNEDGIRLPLIGKNFWTGTINLENKKESTKISDDISLINKSFLMPFQTKTGEYFIQKGFKKNPQNSYEFKEDVIVQFRTAYERDNLKCVVILFETTDPFGNFFCGEVDHRQMELQKPFIPIFGDTDRQATPVTFRVSKIEGDWALGNSSDYVVGYTWIAQQKKGAWKMVWKGNEIALCSDMEKLGIPKSIYNSCYTPTPE